MTHIVFILHEDDIMRERILTALRATPYEMDKNIIKKYNLCDCHPFVSPNIKEMRIYEIDVPEPAGESLKRQMDIIGFRPFNPPFRSLLQRLLRLFVKSIYGKDAKIEIGGTEGTHRMNHRSMRIFTSPDDPADSKNKFPCPICGKNIPSDWK